MARLASRSSVIIDSCCCYRFLVGVLLLSYSIPIRSFALYNRHSSPIVRNSFISLFDSISDDGDDFVGDNGLFPEDQMTSLKERMMEQMNKTKEKNERIGRNWEKGNWSVRGFSLDMRDAKESLTTYPDNKEKNSDPIHICALAMGSEDDYGIAVGRTNGSVYVIELGEEYIAKFSSVAKLRLIEQRNSSNSFAESDGKFVKAIEKE